MTGQVKNGISQKVIIISLVIAVVGLIALLAAEFKKSELGSWYSALTSVLQVVIISSIATLVNEWLIKSDNIKVIESIRDDIKRNTAVKANISELGLVDVYKDANDFKFKEIIENSQNLIVCVNHGRTWLSQRSEYFKFRFRNVRNKTTFIFSDPDGDSAKIIAKKEGKNANDLKLRVEEAIKILRDSGGIGDKLKIYFQPYYTCQTVILADDMLILTPYYNSSGRYSVPLFVYKNMGETSYYHKIHSDIQSLISESMEISGG